MDSLRPTGGTTWLETHNHDGQLGIFNGSISKLKIKAFNKQQKLHLFSSLIKCIRNHPNSIFSEGAVQAITLIWEDIGTTANLSDNLHADDLLAQITFHIFNEECNEMISIILEQLSDIVISGKCPQGRINRLFQLLIAIQKI